MPITINEAKKITNKALRDRDIIFVNVKAVIIDFTDLARMSCIFVRVYGSWSNPKFAEVQRIARDNGFRVETNWMF